MSKHLYRDMDTLMAKILQLGQKVEISMKQALEGLQENDLAKVTRVKESDFEIDQAELEIEEECLKILALHTPVAKDLRFIVALLKVNNDLERMGDLVVNIAERSSYLIKLGQLNTPHNFKEMFLKVQNMVEGALDALVQKDVDIAKRVRSQDDEVDQLNRDMFIRLEKAMEQDSSTIKKALHTLSISRHMERIADLATNIAEDLIFMETGEIVRHQTEEYE